MGNTFVRFFVDNSYISLTRILLKYKVQPINSRSYCFGIGCVFFVPVNFLSKQNCTTRHGMRKPCGLKVRRYAARLIALNEYLDYFPGQS